MKSSHILGGALALALVAGAGWGAWAMLRRPPRVAAPSADPGDLPMFQVSHLGRGELIELQPQVLTPLRTVRWLQPLPGGYAVAQVLTQSDHQLVAVFHEGQLESLHSVPKPEKVTDGFFRLAELKDAVLVPGDALVLLYGGGAAPSLVIALDVNTKALRWSSRIQAEHLALAPGGPATIWAWGASAPPLAMQLWDERASGPERSFAAKALPPEVGEISQLLPLDTRSYQLAHRKGLSTWTGKEWVHVPAPPADPLLGFYGIAGSFAVSGEQAYWQPQPGQLMSLKPAGGVVAMDLNDAGLPKEHERDAKLLRLRGADTKGYLWFDLAMPQLPTAGPTAVPSLAPAAPALAPAAPVAEAPKPDATVTSLTPPTDPRAEWATYLIDGVDRVYRWKPGGRLERIDVQSHWKAAGAPPNVFPPTGVDLHPEAGGFLLGTDQKRWWLPLDALMR